MSTDVQTVAVLALVLIALTSSCAALILVEERRNDPMRRLEYRRPAPAAPDQGRLRVEGKCSACGGAGVRDITEGWASPLPVDCRACKGTGLVEVGA